MSPRAAALLGALAGGAAAGLAAWLLHRRWVEGRGRLLAFALHELNTPATAVSITAVNLLTGVFGEIPPEPLKWLGLLRDQLARLNGLAGELRDLVHLEMAHRPLAIAQDAVAPAKLVEQALADARGGYAQAGIELSARVDPDLPEVLTDGERAPRTLLSLLFHARKFRLRGPVALRARREGASVLCEIEYQGRPLSRAEAAASLELLYPARRRGDQVLAASGLGLGFLRSVTRRAGGELSFAVDGEGRSRLVLSLPVAP